MFIFAVIVMTLISFAIILYSHRETFLGRLCEMIVYGAGGYGLGTLVVYLATTFFK